MTKSRNFGITTVINGVWRMKSPPLTAAARRGSSVTSPKAPSLCTPAPRHREHPQTRPGFPTGAARPRPRRSELSCSCSFPKSCYFPEVAAICAARLPWRASLLPSLLLLREELSEQMRNSRTRRIKSLLCSRSAQGTALDFSCS